MLACAFLARVLRTAGASLEGVLSGTQPASLRSYSRGSYKSIFTVRSAQTHSRWARCPATDFVELMELSGAADFVELPRVQKLQISRCVGGVGMRKTGMCTRVF